MTIILMDIGHFVCTDKEVPFRFLQQISLFLLGEFPSFVLGHIVYPSISVDFIAILASHSHVILKIDDFESICRFNQV